MISQEDDAAINRVF